MAMIKTGSANGWNVVVFTPEQAKADQPPTFLRSTFKVGPRYRCTMTIDPVAAASPGAKGFMRCDWEPCLPKKLSKADLHAYQAGRNALYQRAANAIGGNVMLVE